MKSFKKKKKKESFFFLNLVRWIINDLKSFTTLNNAFFRKMLCQKNICFQNVFNTLKMCFQVVVFQKKCSVPFLLSKRNPNFCQKERKCIQKNMCFLPRWKIFLPRYIFLQKMFFSLLFKEKMYFPKNHFYHVRQMFSKKMFQNYFLLKKIKKKKTQKGWVKKE